MTEQEKKRCHLKNVVKIMLAVLAVGMIIFVIWLLLFTTAKPTITVNYLEQYNELSCPANYNEQDNAWPLYLQAFDAFKLLPQNQPQSLKDAQGKIGSLTNIWLGDLDSNSQKFITKWLKSNEMALGYARQASKKPYYWVPATAPNNQLIFLNLPKLNELKRLRRALICKAMLDAFEDKLHDAFSELMVAHRISNHLSREGDLIGQLCAMNFNRQICKSVALILDRKVVDSDTLARFQDTLEEHRIHANSLSYRKEKLLVRDTMQWLFTDNGKGDGHLIPREYNNLFSQYEDRSYLFDTTSFHYPGRWKALKIRLKLTMEDASKDSATIWKAIKHDGRKQTAEKLNASYQLMEKMVLQTPWQLHSKGTTYKQRLLTIINLEKDLFLGMLFPAVQRLNELHHQHICEQSALITILALKRHISDMGGHPNNLDVLINNGYLQMLPRDPYSDGPLIYRKAGDSFVLYSVGRNFKDDGGKHVGWGTEEEKGDYVFWPVQNN